MIIHTSQNDTYNSTSIIMILFLKRVIWAVGNEHLDFGVDAECALMIVRPLLRSSETPSFRRGRGFLVWRGVLQVVGKYASRRRGLPKTHWTKLALFCCSVWSTENSSSSLLPSTKGSRPGTYVCRPKNAEVCRHLHSTASIWWITCLLKTVLGMTDWKWRALMLQRMSTWSFAILPLVVLVFLFFSG